MMEDIKIVMLESFKYIGEVDSHCMTVMFEYAVKALSLEGNKLTLTINMDRRLVDHVDCSVETWKKLDNVVFPESYATLLISNPISNVLFEITRVEKLGYEQSPERERPDLRFEFTGVRQSSEQIDAIAKAVHQHRKEMGLVEGQAQLDFIEKNLQLEYKEQTQ
jgi:hypothetical protein